MGHLRCIRTEWCAKISFKIKKTTNRNALIFFLKSIIWVLVRGDTPYLSTGLLRICQVLKTSSAWFMSIHNQNNMKFNLMFFLKFHIYCHSLRSSIVEEIYQLHVTVLYFLCLDISFLKMVNQLWRELILSGRILRNLIRNMTNPGFISIMPARNYIIIERVMRARIFVFSIMMVFCWKIFHLLKITLVHWPYSEISSTSKLWTQKWFRRWMYPRVLYIETFLYQNHLPV